MPINYKDIIIPDTQVRRFKGNVSTLLKDNRFRQEDILICYELTSDQIIRLLSSSNGAVKFKYIVDFLSKIKGDENESYYLEAKEKGVLDSFIVVSAYDGSINAFNLLREKWKFFLEKGYTLSQIIRIISRSGGTSSLQAVINYDAILKEMKCETADIVDAASHAGGSKTLDQLAEYFDTLHKLGYTKKQIISIAKHDGGSNNIETIFKLFIALKEIGCTIEQTVKIASHNGGSKNLIALIKYAPEILLPIKDRIVIKEEIAQAAEDISLTGDVIPVEGAVPAEGIDTDRYTLDQIVRVVAHGGGQKNLEALMAFKNKEAFKKLCAAQGTDWKKAICNFMNKNSMAKRLKRLEELLAAPDVSLEKKDICRLLDKIKGMTTKKLENIFSNKAHLTTWLETIPSKNMSVGGIKRLLYTEAAVLAPQPDATQPPSAKKPKCSKELLELCASMFHKKPDSTKIAVQPQWPSGQKGLG